MCHICINRHISEDIENIDRLKLKLNVPDAPPNPNNISPDIEALNTMIGARYLGDASQIRLKTPKEGFSMQCKLLKRIRAGYEGQLDKVFMMGREQHAVVRVGPSNYCVFGGHGSGRHGV